MDCRREIDPNKMKRINEPLKVEKNPRREKKNELNPESYKKRMIKPELFSLYLFRVPWHCI